MIIIKIQTFKISKFKVSEFKSQKSKSVAREIEFDDGSGNKFKLPQELFIDEQIEDLKKLSGIEK